jgi:UDP-glucose 4-epimerase
MQEKNKILITGASGFLGTALVQYMNEKSLCIIQASRANIAGAECHFKVKKEFEQVNWLSALVDVDVVIHLAARVHMMQEHLSNPLDEYRRINTEGTINLAKQASEAGVRRFIFLSTAKVNGEWTIYPHRFTEIDKPSPADYYSLSKYEAERELELLSIKSGMEVVILRPPLTYGPNVKGNLYQLMWFLSRGIPLPFGGVNSKRSMISIQNLVEIITICVDHPNAANNVYLVSDDNDISVSELINKINIEMNSSSFIFSPPLLLLKFLTGIFGQTKIYNKTCLPFQLDITKLKSSLGWVPANSLEHEISMMVADFFKSQNA